MLRLVAIVLCVSVLCSCAPAPYKPYVPVGSRLNGGDAHFYRWASSRL